VLATTSAVYVTNRNKAGTRTSADGVLVSATSVGTSTFNVGGN